MTRSPEHPTVPEDLIVRVRDAATAIAANGALNSATHLQGLPVDALARQFDLPAAVIRWILTR